MQYIAHFRYGENHTEEAQTVAAHLTGVAALMEKYAEAAGLPSLARLTGLLHDIGKLSMEFQGYLKHNFHHPEKQLARGSVDHATAGGKFLFDRYADSEDMGALAVIQLAGLVIFSHHSPMGLLNFLSATGKADYQRRLEKEDIPAIDTMAFFRDVISEEDLDTLFHQAAEEVCLLAERIQSCIRDDDEDRAAATCHFFWGMTEKMLYSMLVDADWLDTASFAQGRKTEALQKHWHYDALWQDFSKKLEAKLNSFPEPEDEKVKLIMAARRKVSDDARAAASRPEGIYRLSAPTGSGKTLASMRFALHHALRFHKKHIYVILPYTSIIDQNAQVIRDIFQCDDAVLEHHSNILPEEEREEASVQEKENRKLLTERWDVPVVFTTQVQFLNALFAGSVSASRRLRALRESVIIFDEAQSLPVKCTYLFNQAMNYLAAFQRDTIVLCTATQPELGKVKYPLHFSPQPEMIKNLPETAAAFHRVHIEKDLPPGGKSIEELAAEIVPKAVQEGNLLLICNLTKEARLLYEEAQRILDEDGSPCEAYHLSTKMCSAHRKDVLRLVKQKLKAREPVLLISTQLIEAGVDISFSCVYRVLAGSASIAQAAGRCNRHGEKEKGEVRIVSLENENLSRLPDIENGARVTRDLLALGTPADQLLQPDVLQKYFQEFYRKYTEKQKEYAIEKHPRLTLLDLLSSNAYGCDIYEQKGGDLAAFPCFLQAFRDAGEAFHVIDTETIGILTPYAKGEEFIEAFDQPVRPWEMGQLYQKIRRAQNYTVNVFSYELKKLEEEGAIWKTEAGILALRKEYYDKKVGIEFELQKNDFCMI